MGVFVINLNKIEVKGNNERDGVQEDLEII